MEYFIHIKTVKRISGIINLHAKLKSRAELHNTKLMRENQGQQQVNT